MVLLFVYFHVLILKIQEENWTRANKNTWWTPVFKIVHKIVKSFWHQIFIAFIKVKIKAWKDKNSCKWYLDLHVDISYIYKKTKIQKQLKYQTGPYFLWFYTNDISIFMLVVHLFVKETILQKSNTKQALNFFGQHSSPYLQVSWQFLSSSWNFIKDIYSTILPVDTRCQKLSFSCKQKNNALSSVHKPVIQKKMTHR